MDIPKIIIIIQNTSSGSQNLNVGNKIIKSRNLHFKKVEKGGSRITDASVKISHTLHTASAGEPVC